MMGRSSGYRGLRGVDFKVQKTHHKRLHVLVKRFGYYPERSEKPSGE